ncbi:hypothetical protein GCM10025768_21390 [Microbacterium pseudoresistens]|uniref:Uncharacterized protein n=1 Tax=Microbacterium pseudoresistens TaxID=640634 RepID=A0A7Y9JLZ2_9MICO|nr:DUF6350 family protein [Microbacterium pseudoresistens]NYD53436.1 hypothetical protein [Microbacterium pseudoresistens]
MQRLLIVILAAVDAVVAAAVGLGALLAPLTVLWTLAFGLSADWGALWPTTATLWQFGHAVPMDVTIPDAVLRSAGIAPDAATFTLSVFPLAFLVFTALFAARSGHRAAHAGAWIPGVASGTVVFAVIATAVVLTGRLDLATTPWVLGIAAPALAYLCGAGAGAVITAWVEGDGGIVDALHDRVDGWGRWHGVVPDALRGASAALVGLLGSSAAAVALAALLRGGEMVSLFESLRVDALGTTVISLGQLGYLPTLVVWALSWIAGPGFSLGTGTAISPAGTELGVVPGIPVLGLLPETSSPWMLVVVLAPIAAGALAGWIVRSRIVSEGRESGYGPRTVTAVTIAALAGAGAAMLAALASGSLGPGRLAVAGPDPGPVALAVGVEVLIGAAILLLAPLHRTEFDAVAPPRHEDSAPVDAPLD